MAIHKLGSELFRNLKFNDYLWHSEDVSKIGSIVHDLFPSLRRVTSKSENRAFAWLYGKIQVEGEGIVQVIYPYTDSSRDVLTLRNVDFSVYPWVSLYAKAEDKWIFKGWYDSVTMQLVEEQPNLLLTEDTYTENTGFVAMFEENEDSLGI